MAIVRTTPRETGTTGSAPPVAKTPSTTQRGPRMPQRGPSRPGVNQPANSGEFFNDVQAELRRVTWPTTEEVRSGVIVTIGLLIFFAFYIFGLDYIAEKFIAAMVQAKS